jgi:hypothetical protein
MTVVNALCASFPARIELMAAAGRETIQPLLSSHKKEVPAGYLPDRPHLVEPPPWTPEEDELVTNMAPNTRALLEATARQLTGKSLESVMNRWKILRTQRKNHENFPDRMVSIYDFLKYGG